MLAWLTERRAIALNVIIEARVGADPGPRHLDRPDGLPRVFPAVMFPVLDADGRVIYTLSRHLRPAASRWWNTAERAAPNPRLAFYGPPRPGPIIVTEGPIDALSARAAGYRATAVLGAGNVDATIADRLTAERRRLVLAFDNDPEGQAATDRLVDLLDEREARWCSAAIPDQYNDLNAWHVVCQNRWRDIMHTNTRLGSVANSPPTASSATIA